MKTLTILFLCLSLTACYKFRPAPGKPIVVSKPDTIPNNGYIGITAIAIADTVAFRDETLIEFNYTTHTAYIPGEDAPYFPGFGNTSFASLSSDSIALAVNAQPYKAGRAIPLQLRGKTVGQYYIRISQLNSIPVSLKIWLKDTKLADSVNLRAGSYAFSIPQPNIFDSSRFKLIIR